MIKDSGDRTQFETGAVRDMQEGKGRCDLLPPAALLRIAKHFEAGAVKYGDRNWELGIPMHSFVDSGIRHLLKYMDGWTDEDHLCAAAWNILCALETEEKRPKMQDIPSRLKAVNEAPKEEEKICLNCLYKNMSGNSWPCSKCIGCGNGDRLLWESEDSPSRIAPPDLRSMKGQMVYFVPFMGDEKPRWMQVVLDFITNPAMKMWALYKNTDDFMYLSEIEDLGMVFTGECNPELTEDDLEKMDGQTVWVDWGPEAVPNLGIESAFHTVEEKDLYRVNGGRALGGFEGIGIWKGWPKVYRYEKTND